MGAELYPPRLSAPAVDLLQIWVENVLVYCSFGNYENSVLVQNPALQSQCHGPV